ncbi:hypothetical protein [Bradyrhizobium forestalis]|uniref:hypothetical protein n=1 Tax=Bradyrhizobium forestalis TaxID=1419263 RepID=UPI0011AF6708|nr:hypothetical protein [Bradyrhizobium forestalis]
MRVAYGTSKLNKAKRGEIDLIIESQEDIDECGLAVATRFDLETTAVIPWEPPDCDCWHGQYSPKLGSLSIDRQVDCAHKLTAIQNKSKK